VSRTHRAIAAGLLGCTSLCCGGGDRPNIILITLDTTRADHLSCYGYERETSPNVDALAREATVFERAYAVSSWTLPTHASIFTGRYPKSHGARYDPEGPVAVTPPVHRDVNAPPQPEVRVRMLAPTTGTLAQLLKKRGYKTSAAVAGPWMKEAFGLSLGFDSYDEEDIHMLYGRLGESVSDAALGFLEEVDSGPFMLFLNYYDAHQPWGRPAMRCIATWIRKPSIRCNGCPKARSTPWSRGSAGRTIGSCSSASTTGRFTTWTPRSVASSTISNAVACGRTAG
jgi:hypothetical protein